MVAEDKRMNSDYLWGRWCAGKDRGIFVTGEAYSFYFIYSFLSLFLPQAHAEYF
jgi:hypothetical protein